MSDKNLNNKEKDYIVTSVKVIESDGLKKDAAPEPAKNPKTKEKKVYKGGALHKDYDLEFRFLNILIIGFIFIGLFVTLAVVKRASGFVASENRNYAELPELSFETYINGDFTSGITKYYTDTIPIREQLKSLANKFESLFGLSLDDTKVVGSKGTINNEKFDSNIKITTATAVTFSNSGGAAVTSTTTASSASIKTTSVKPAETTAENSSSSNEKKDDEYVKNGIILTGSGENIRAMEGYGGGFENGKKYAGYLNEYKQKLGDNVNVYNMCIPMASAFYLPDKYKNTYASQIDNINNIRSYLKNVVDIPAYEELSLHTDEKIYSRTDHHWQPLGAYYAAKAFAEKAGLTDFKELSEYQSVTKKKFVGTLYSYSKSEALKNNPEDFVYYRPPNIDSLKTIVYNTKFKNGTQSYFLDEAITNRSNYYMVFGGDETIRKIKTNANTNRILVIAKDSFGNALTPFLTESFKEIYVCDTRYTDTSLLELIKKVGATDVLFAECLFSSTSDKAQDIKDIM